MRSLLQNTFSKIPFVVALILGMSSADAFADNFRTKTTLTGASKNWNDGSTWDIEASPNNWQPAGARFPSFNDDVAISQGNQINLSDAVVQCKSLTLNPSNAGTTLLQIGSNNLRVYGNITMLGTGNTFTQVTLTSGLLEVQGNILDGGAILQSSNIPTGIGNNDKNRVTVSNPTYVSGTSGPITNVQTNKTAITPLPVELISFTAVKKASEVALTWETASEKFNTGFEVQSSADGKNYEAVGFVATQNGTSSSTQRYAFSHKTANKEGLVYYRLKQIDLDGTFEYYTAKVVDLGRFTSSANVYPNPFQNQFALNLQATATETAQITVTDMTGKTVYAAEQKLQKGANALKVELNDQPAGLYLLKATAGDQTYINRLVKQ